MKRHFYKNVQDSLFPVMKRNNRFLILFLLFQLCSSLVQAQMRQVYLDLVTDNDLKKISFFSPTSGFVAFHDCIGYTTDSGRTFDKRYINIGNVNYQNQSVNLTFGFTINGVKAFNQNTVLVYGDYGYVPSILYSTDGGNSFILVYHTSYTTFPETSSMRDMVFPENNSVGYAVDADRVLKTVNGGQSWGVIKSQPGESLSFGGMMDNNNGWLFNGGKLLKLTGGLNTTQVTIPAGPLYAASFISASVGWTNIAGKVYSTVNGGTTWTARNNVLGLSGGKMQFVNDSTGYALYGLNILKTTDSGRIWEPLQREHYDNGYADIFFWNKDQFWAGGSRGFLDISTNAGGPTLPKAFFSIDTTNMGVSGPVNLINQSKQGYSYQWFKNDTLIGTSYNASYVHYTYSLRDTIKLIVSNGTNSEAIIHYQDFYPPVVVSSFTPTSAASGSTVTITGNYFSGVTSVKFGGIPASYFTVPSANTIQATVGSGGASGDITVTTVKGGTASLPGFTYIPPPDITSFTPAAATAGTTVTITGTNFNNVSAVSFAGIPATSYTVVSSTTITAVVPSGKSGSVSVVTNGGTDATPGFVALPSITSFTPGTSTQGSLLKITGTSLSEVTGVTVGGVAVQSFTIQSLASIHAYIGPGASGDVTVIAPGGSAILSGFTYVPPPSITSFSPVSGAVGSTVTITGNNFNASTAGNTVYFGSTKAVVTAASTTSLTVTVPAGSSFMPVSVVCNNLIAYTRQPFHVIFPDGAYFTPNSFTVQQLSNNTGAENSDLDMGDIDGDGKTDIVVHNNGLGVAIFRNGSQNEALSFADPIALPLSADCQRLIVGDVDGDGKLDIVFHKGNTNAIVWYRNISSPGNVAFDDPFTLGILGGTRLCLLTDMDKDGKTDVVVGYNGGVAVFRNTGESDDPSFDFTIYTIGGGFISIGDLDIDGKPDIIVTGFQSNLLYVIKNNSTPGNISLTKLPDLPASSLYISAAGDIDGDGMPDIAAVDYYGNKMAVYRNTGTAGNMSFADPVEFATDGSPTAISLSDLNGDGKLDVAVTENPYNIALFSNTSVPGTIVFRNRVDYTPGAFLTDFGIHIADLNGDTRPDPVVISADGRNMNIYINQASPKPYIGAFTPSQASAGSAVTITGYHFTGVSNVSFGGVAAASFIINSDSSITAVVGGGATGDVRVTNSYGTDSSIGFIFGNPAPVITSFFPASGPVGSNITITGSGFSDVAANNIVYFGGVKTTVTAANSGQLTLKVPAGASPDLVSVTVAGLTAYTTRPFIVTFSADNTPFSDTSFVAATVLADNDKPGCIGDFDGDGKLDIVLASSITGLSVAKNTSIPGQVSFASRTVIDAGLKSVASASGDLDGDGKTDVAALDGSTNTFSIFRNITNSSVIAFESRINYPVNNESTSSSGIAINDIDLDGRPDIVISHFNSHSVYLFKNLSTQGNIIFAQPISYITGGGWPQGVVTRDIDGDNKPDIVVQEGYYTSGVSAMRNTSVNGVLSFSVEPRFFWISSAISGKLAVGDLDGDDKPDIVVPQNGVPSTGVIHNQSTPGNVSFLADYIISENITMHAAIGDLNGDGKQDLVTQSYLPTNFFSVYRNITDNAGIEFDDKKDYKDFTEFPAPSYGLLADADGDGVLDIFTYQNTKVVVMRNTMGTPGSSSTTIRLCAASDTVLKAGITGASYQWQQDTGNGFADISNGNGINGSNSASLQLSSVPESWNGYKFRCMVDGTAGNVYNLVVNSSAPASVTISASATAICAGTLVTFTAIPVNGGSTPSYQWLKNNVSVGTGNSYTDNNLVNNDTIVARLTSNAACVSSPAVASNKIIMMVNSKVAPSVSITATATTICSGTTVIFRATPVNGGAAPVYQWKKNGVNVVASGDTYTTTNLANGDIITVVLTSNATCITTPTATSNSLTMTVSGTTPSVSIAATATTICSGTNVTFTATPVNGGAAPAYQWKKNGVNVGTNSNTYSDNALANGDVITVVLTSNAPCATLGTVTSNNIVMIVGGGAATPSVSITATSTNTCSGQSITFTATPVNGGTSPVYQWQVNGVNTGTNSNVFTTTALANGAQVKVILTNSAGCGGPVTTTSNVITVQVSGTAAVIPVVSISGTTVVIKGQFSILAASVTNGGTDPVYQWQDSTQTHGWLNITGATGRTVVYTPVATGDKIRCMLTSNAACAVPAMVASAPLVFTVNVTTAIPSVPAATYGIHAYPNPVYNTLTIDTLKLSDRWQTLEITSVDGKQNIITRSIRNQTRVSVSVAALSKGQYIVLLRKKTGEAVYIMFIRM